MKLNSLVVLRPVCFFIFLAFIVLLFPSCIIPYGRNILKRIEYDVKLDTQNIHSELLSEIEKVAKLLLPINSSATSLARILSPSINGTKPSFTNIETKVAPVLFQAISIVPYLSQISYIGLDGLLFSYYTTGGSRTFAVYSNLSLSSVNSSKNTWYSQSVNRDTGKLYGKAISFQPLITLDASWFLKALNASNGYASLENGWNHEKDLLFLNSASINRKGVISLGFPAKTLAEFFSGVEFYGSNVYLAAEGGKVLIQGLPNTRIVPFGDSVSLELKKSDTEQIARAGNFSCKPNDGSLKTSALTIWGRKYRFYCSPIEVLGVRSVYLLAFPYGGLESLVHNNSKLALMLLIAMLAALSISIFTFVFLMIRAARRQMYLCAVLIKQMEATQQAERKSMNKSFAFASASHDIRASLAGLIGLIELCHGDVSPHSELETNLSQMEGCVNDLLGLLNSILDASKVESGKMQLEEEEFNLAKLLEDVVDLYHPVAVKKGLDVILDPCDGSISKFPNVKGDRGKLKQILCNLLSNAVKFTSEGHIIVRAWARKPRMETSIIASNKNGFLSWLSNLFDKNKKAQNDLEIVNEVQQNPNSMEFVFEVDDTGKGIPKEKQKSVFENYVQVKETALGQGGTGLGLGIVQSLVRLMGGDIGIEDKEFGMKGTRFKFNIFLTVDDSTELIDNEKVNNESQFHFDGMSGSSHQNIRKEGSQVVLFIRSKERRRISRKFMENLGLKVWVVKEVEQLVDTLIRLKRKLNLSHYSSSERSDFSSSLSLNSGTIGAKDVPLSAMVGDDHTLLPFHKTAKTNFTLIVIDASEGPFNDLRRAVAEFRRDLHSTCCTVAWLDKPTTRNIHFRGLDEDKLSPYDHIITKPFHGSRLYKVIRLLPEFGGAVLSGFSPQSKKGRGSSGPSSPVYPAHMRSKSKSLPYQGQPNQHAAEIEVVHLGPMEGNPLMGKKVLVAEDNVLLQKLALHNVSALGGTVEACGNGLEAVQLVFEGFSDLKMNGGSTHLPYDYILMDCQMPIMNGYEATRRIREEEKRYNVHIPIIALTAHAANDSEGKETLRAGMDFLLTKPLNKAKLKEAIRFVNNNLGV